MQHSNLYDYLTRWANPITAVCRRYRLIRGWLRPALALLLLGGPMACGKKDDDSTQKHAAPASEQPVETQTTPSAAVPLPPDVAGDAELTWTTPFGPAGATVPELPYPPATGDSAGTFSKLVAVIFPPDGRDILFVGVAEPDKPSLDPQELLDSFVVAFRAVSTGQAPGVSIDPTPEQLARNLQEDDALVVRYIGGDEGTVFGLTAFEADRLMKCLSFGKDNITKEAFGCSVPGYRTELDLLAESAGNTSGSWHRFWIEPLENRVSQSSDGRTFLVDNKLGIKTEYMVPRGGKLESGDRPPDPSAKAFANHMTEHYAAYASALPVYNKLWAFAQLTSVAEAVRPAAEGTDNASRPRPALDLAWLLSGYRPQSAATPATTPAAIVTRETTTVTGTVRVTSVRQLSGGVNLKPQNNYQPADRKADLVQREILAARAAQPQRAWAVTVEGAQFQVVSQRLAPSELRLWQTDLQVGSVECAREYSASAGQPSIGRGWSLRLPRLSVSDTTVELEGAGKRPQAIHVQDKLGAAVTLDRPATLTMPSQPSTFGYAARDGRAKIYCYSNLWVYIEGEVKFVSINNSPPMLELAPGARVIEFSPDAEHQVRSARTDKESLSYEYDGDRLTGLRDERGNSIRLHYDDQGRCSALQGSNGKRIEYRYDSTGRLDAVLNEQGQAMSYQNSSVTGDPVAVRTERGDTPATASPPNSQFVVHSARSLGSEETAKLPASFTAQNAALLSVELGPSDYTIMLNGKPLPSDGRLKAHVETVLAGADTDGTHAASLRTILQLDAADLPATLVVHGSLDIRDKLAQALRMLEHDVSVTTASDPYRAVENLARRPRVRGPAQMVVHEDGLIASARERLKNTPSAPTDSPVVFVVFHYSKSSVKRLYQLGDAGAFNGNYAVLIACGTQETPGTVEQILRSFGAVGVSGFSQPINQRLLVPLIGEIQHRFRSKTPSGTRDEVLPILLDAVEKLLIDSERGQGPVGIERKDIENLKMLFDQIGMQTKWRGVVAPVASNSPPSISLSRAA